MNQGPVPNEGAGRGSLELDVQILTCPQLDLVGASFGATVDLARREHFHHHAWPPTKGRTAQLRLSI